MRKLVRKEQFTKGEKQSLMTLVVVFIAGGLFFLYITNSLSSVVGGQTSLDTLMYKTGMTRFLPKVVTNSISKVAFKNPFDGQAESQGDQLSVSSVQTKNDLQKIGHDLDGTDFGSMDSQFKQLEDIAAK
jgi:hypothetical protein